jgi:tRNA dimethylallyltransferase
VNKAVPTGVKSIVVVVGPTAVGKTAYAIKLALELGTEIISADSRQCYREMNIGVARPSPEELAMVKHHFIASHSILDVVNAAVFESYALNALSRIFELSDTAVVVGGTGLYIKALCEGIDVLPQANPTVRSEIIDNYEKLGLPWLQEQVRLLDPEFYAEGEIQNPRRLMRALEVVQSTGRSIRSFQSGKIATRPFSIIKIGLDLPRGKLYDRINYRVDRMMDAGLLQEAEDIFNRFNLFSLPKNSWPSALNTVGYSELFDYFKGNLGLEEAVELIKQHTRNYAKRQLTWFRKDLSIQWLPPTG